MDAVMVQPPGRALLHRVGASSSASSSADDALLRRTAAVCRATPSELASSSTSLSADALLQRAAAACGVAPSELALFCGGRQLRGPAPLRRVPGSLRVAWRLVGGGGCSSSVQGKANFEQTMSKRAGTLSRSGATSSAVSDGGGGGTTPLGGLDVSFKPQAKRSPARAVHVDELSPFRRTSGREVEVGEKKMVLWKERGGAEVEAALASGAVALLDSAWVVDLAARRGVLRPRQALPDEAFLSLSKVQAQTRPGCLPIVCISHCWLQPDHPDPHGHNLRVIARALRELSRFGERFGVFYNFCSIHQRCRDRDGKPQGRLVGELDVIGRFSLENSLFEQALGCLGAFYSHRLTWVLMLTEFPPDYFTSDYELSSNVAPYFERGWCFCEATWAATMLKSSGMVLDLGMDTGEGRVGVGKCLHGRKAPVLPEEFDAQLASKSFTNGKGDAPLVAALYRQGFNARFGAATLLNYANLGWGPEEARAVAGVLPRAPALEELYLGRNLIGPEGARALAEALPRTLALETLRLDHNSIGDEGARALAEALPHAASLRELELRDNRIGAKGAQALAEAIPDAPALKVLSLNNNAIGDEGACAMAWALPHTPMLKQLRLENNSIGSEGARALAHALPQAPALEVLNLNSNFDLNRNCIGVEGARALAEALPRASALEWLFLNNNSIGDEGAWALAEALPHAPALKVRFTR